MPSTTVAIGVITNVDVKPADAISAGIIRGFSRSESDNFRHGEFPVFTG
jgi:hypothetical protein